MSEKPKCKLIGENGNIFNLTGLARRALRKSGLEDQASEMTERVFKAKLYDEALSIILDYVDAEEED